MPYTFISKALGIWVCPRPSSTSCPSTISGSAREDQSSRLRSR